MQHYWALDDVHTQNSWLTIGSFDGVHRGHQKIIQELTAGAHAENAPAVVLTFFPHPATILRGYDYPFYLTTAEERARLLGELGADIVITHPFDETVAATSARDFMVGLHRHLNIRHLRVGYDFALGKNRQGDIHALRQLGEELGFSLRRTEPVLLDGDIISSSRIRFLLGAGQVAEAAELLGRTYVVHGVVEHGDQRGATLGFPTANLAVWAEQAIPAAGVYVCRAHFGGQSWGAVTNIGVRPTFESLPVNPRVESHILDFEGDLYGETIQLEIISRLRGERRFPNVDALVEQIRKDVHAARQDLAG